MVTVKSPPPRYWCRKHWAEAVAVSNIDIDFIQDHIIGMVLEDAAFLKKCGLDPKRGGTVPGERINTELEKLGYSCCYLGERRMSELFLISSFYGERQ